MLSNSFSMPRSNFLKLSIEDRLKFFGILLFMCVGLGVLISFLKFSPEQNLAQSIVIWVLELFLGTLIYSGTWLVCWAVFKWKFRAEILKHLHFSFLSVNLIFVAILLLTIYVPHDHPPPTEAYQTTWFWVAIVLWVQVLCVCILVELFLSVSGFLKIVEKLFNSDDVKEERMDEEEPLQNIITFEGDKKIPSELISHITIENNFCTVVYLEDSDVKSSGTYTNLRYFENQCPDFFLRINRSTLINPTMVMKIEKVQRQYQITMKGDSTHSFLVSRSKSDMVISLMETN